MDNLMLRDDSVESCTILKDKENSRFQQKSGIFMAGAERFELSTRGFGVAVETAREHRGLPICTRVCSSGYWIHLRSSKICKRRSGRDVVANSAAHRRADLSNQKLRSYIQRIRSRLRAMRKFSTAVTKDSSPRSASHRVAPLLAICGLVRAWVG